MKAVRYGEVAAWRSKVMRRLLFTLVLLSTLLSAHAQEEPEYRLEVGAGLGGVSYSGDFSGGFFKGIQPWMALVAKYRFNPRMALGFDVATGKIKGSTADVDTWYPIEPYEFSHQLTEADVRFEYNFWPYGTGREYRGAHPLTPFITLGLGITHHSGTNSGVTMNLPLGAGVKWKVAPRLNIIAEWAIRFTPSDYLDGKSDVYGIKSGGLFKNADCYHAFQLSVTYDIWAKCKTCHQE